MALTTAASAARLSGIVGPPSARKAVRGISYNSRGAAKLVQQENPESTMHQSRCVPPIFLPFLFKHASFGVACIIALLVLGGCASTGTLPDEARTIVIEQLLHNPDNEFGGCAAEDQDCKETVIQYAYNIPPTTLPPPYQHYDVAWCVEWRVVIRHPINGNYYDLIDWAVVLQEGSTYTAIEAPTRYIGDMLICSK